MMAVAETMVSVRAKVAMINSAITEIGANAEGATHCTPMHARDRHRRERAADDGVGFGDGGRDAVKGEGQRSQDQRRADEKLLHDSTPLVRTKV
jgi:hypothetical protein